MPIYEFKCRDCDRLTSIFVRTPGAEHEAACHHCGSHNLSRLISGFSYHKSEQTILQEYGAEPKRLEDYRDPRQIGRWVERRFDEMGEELPEHTRKMIDSAREGEMPEPMKDL
jgi:putative FmdB family regulatory protein